MEKNVFYINDLKRCSGITSHILYIAKRYKDWDITLYYKTGDKEQLDRLSKYIRVRRYNNKTINCDKIFFNNNHDILDNVVAKEKCMIIHTNCKALKNFKPNISSKIDKYYGVSQVVCDSFKETTGIDCEVLYTPIELEEPNKVLKLVSCTRNSDEKGRNRYITLANMLDNMQIPYEWLLFVDDVPSNNYKKHMIYMPSVLNVADYMCNADYLVQLSDENIEGYGLTPVESLTLGVPIISTKQDVYKELGITEQHGFFISDDMSDVPINEIYKKAGTFKFKYEPKKCNWDTALVKGKSTYTGPSNKKYLVEATDAYFENGVTDGDLGFVPRPGHQWCVDEERLEVLLGNNSSNTVYVTVVKELEPGLKNGNPIKVSVIIPVYNQEKLISRCIESIPNRDDIEIIVIDDKSTDKTLESLKNIKRKITILENKENMGVGYTFNKGLDSAKGTYVLRIDSDDYMYSNVFNYIVDNELDGTDMVYYNLEINSGKLIELNKNTRKNHCGTVKFIRNEFIGSTRCPNIRTAEDKHFNDSLLAKRPTEKFTNKTLIHYNYPREGSLYDLTLKGILK